MSNESNTVEPSKEAAVAAREASQQAAEQARELAADAVKTIKALDRPRMSYLAALAIVGIFTLVFDIASFRVGQDGPVSETQAAAERAAQARLNSWSYSAFSSCMWGKLAWASAAFGVAVVLWSAMTKSSATWVPLAEIGSAAIATLLLLLLYFVAFPDLSAYDDASASATLLGYWVPLTAAIMASGFSTHRILRA